MTNYTDQYGDLLRETIRGAKVRAFFLGYRSNNLNDYLEQQKKALFRLREEASDAGEEIRNRRNDDLGFKIFTLEARIMKSKIGLI
jgi:hypothetical protein